MSDVHCPARVFVLPQIQPDQPGQSGDAPVAAVAELLRPERIAAVHHAHDLRQQASRLAQLLRVKAVTTDALREAADPLPGSVVSALEGIADAYRGEAVAVLLNDSALQQLLPQLAATAPSGPAAEWLAESGTIVELSADADGWRLVGAQQWEGQ